MARTKGKQTLKDVKLDEISFVGRGDNPEAHVLLLKIKPPVDDEDSKDELEDEDEITKKGENDMSVELKEKLEKAEAKVTELEKENETLKAACATAEEDKKKLEDKFKKEDEENKIDKSALPEAVVKQLEKLEKQAEDNAAQVAVLKDAEVTREYVGKAAELQTIGKVDEIGSVLKSIAAVSKDAAEKVFELFKAADAKIRTGGLLKEVGGDDTSGGSSAYDKIVAKASELRKTHPELTDAQAFTKVYDTDTELRKAYIADRK